MSADTPRPERVTLSDEERQQFENRLRWHFNVVAKEGKGSIYASLGIDNAVLDVERILAAREQALREEVAREQAALAIPPGSDHFQHGYECGLLDAVSITLSGPR